MARKIGAPVYALPEDISEVFYPSLFLPNSPIVAGEAQDGDDRVRKLDACRHEVEEPERLHFPSVT